MPLFRITPDRLDAVQETSFPEQKIRERVDLQRLLRDSIEVVAPGVLVIGEEFAEWTDSRRRIDLLGVDSSANLVVIELKRDDDGSHMELQAIRYAAMVSTMTFARAVDCYQDYLNRRTPGLDAQQKLLSFLGWASPREDDFAKDVRIVLVSAEFSKEVTTAVLWLNERDLDIRCVRLKLYKVENQLLIDAQQVIPLPEAIDRTIQIRQKEQAQRLDRADRHGERNQFWTDALPVVSELVPRWKRFGPRNEGWIEATSGRPWVSFQLWVYTDQCGVNIYLDGGPERPGWAKAVFDALESKRLEIEKKFGKELSWQRLNEKRASIISSSSIRGGYRTPKETWPQIHAELARDALRFETVILEYLDDAVNTANISTA